MAGGKTKPKMRKLPNSVRWFLSIPALLITTLGIYFILFVIIRWYIGLYFPVASFYEFVGKLDLFAGSAAIIAAILLIAGAFFGLAAVALIAPQPKTVTVVAVTVVAILLIIEVVALFNSHFTLNVFCRFASLVIVACCLGLLLKD